MVKKRTGKKIEKRLDKWHCISCSKSISPTEKQVVVITKVDGKHIEESYFHFQCWIDYFNERVSLKAKANVGEMQEQVMSLLKSPMIAGILSQVQGSGSLMSMLNMPLSNEKTILKNRVKKKIENGRKKRGKKQNKM
jgi:hypothetical protein